MQFGSETQELRVFGENRSETGKFFKSEVEDSSGGKCKARTTLSWLNSHGRKNPGRVPFVFKWKAKGK